MDHVNKIQYLQIIASILTIFSAYLIALPNILGLIIMCIAEVFWIIYCWKTGQYWMMGTNILLIFFNIYGIKRWDKQDLGWGLI